MQALTRRCRCAHASARRVKRDSTRLRLRVQGHQRGTARVDDASCAASAARYVWFHRTEQRDRSRPLDRTANRAWPNRASRLLRHQRDAGSDSLSTGTAWYHLMADIHCEPAGDLSGYGRDCVFRQIAALIVACFVAAADFRCRPAI